MESAPRTPRAQRRDPWVTRAWLLARPFETRPRARPAARGAREQPRREGRRGHERLRPRACRRAERVVALGEEGRVRLGERLPLGGDVVLVEDRLDGADRLAGAAVDALVRVDVEHPLALVDAVDRAFLNARLVLHVDAWLGDHVRHVLSQPPRGLRALAESVPGTPPRRPLPGGNFSWWSRHPTGCWHLTGPEPASRGGRGGPAMDTTTATGLSGHLMVVLRDGR